MGLTIEKYLYILDENHKPVSVDDVKVWGEFFEKDENRRVALYRQDDIMVSTIFIGIAPFGMAEELFETMIFCDSDGDLNNFQRRYTTWDEALENHNKIVEAVKSGSDFEGQERRKTLKLHLK